MSTPAVRITGLTKLYPVHLRRQKVVAVKDLNLDVPEGQVYGLLGPNGSGKSTTLKILLGLVTATHGKTEIFGEDSRDYHSHRDVGFLPENPYFYKFLTAEETIRFYGKICGLGGKALTSKIGELLELVGLEDARHRRVGGFSKGMLQRIGLAQALVQDPRLLVLDEPTAGVDPLGSRQIRDLILEMKRRGKTVLLTSHLLEQVQEVCDRVGIMSRGVMLREGSLTDLITVGGQTEYLVENAPDGLQDKIARLVAESGAKLVETRKPQRTLEKVFLEAIENAQK
ncbi:ABC-2 type transport system ATP-binding protein [Terrimicrobium sacchariphilum]|uniref:ABC-2 type transport system ATP-binding protein n=1 Tax=Terrimicrobium sacchariphilum TaxID=690879 RepID=A0A146G425_TERSA|nr:ABC transporter ATP-binding protein [Terrimicrobium sacchariphilum]GAT31784.1 ABC-2 type transport system ATP-binding protein [Terrimicrobium sacchariphilum]